MAKCLVLPSAALRQSATPMHPTWHPRPTAWDALLAEKASEVDENTSFRTLQVEVVKRYRC